MPSGRFERWSATGLRTRYFPKSRIAQGFISVAPWVNIALLFVFFSLLDLKMVLKPGVTVDLPKMPFREGGGPGAMMLVITSVPSTDTGGREEIVFFDDERFRIKNAEQLERLRQAMSASRTKRPGVDIVIQADQRVLHGTVVNIMNCATEAGIGRVVVATRPPTPEKK